ncbi:hypothetical protein L3Y34_019728 [Caenorhabditis briggsae]|uniref:Uncharacterized protein n=1 Tax=Caenorhabditis briggsae TaxID=6238 RepID=A0AAE9IX28_CAEBR|nr:hypothetical protein L3Y34_019728 [Caenorhabditis briggsae]
MLLHPTIFLIGCSLASFISPQYVNSYGYGYAVNDLDGSGNGNNNQNSNSVNSNSVNLNSGNSNSGNPDPAPKGGNSRISGYVTGNNGQTGGQILRLGPNGKLLITNCNVCRLCCIGKNVTYEIENLTDRRDNNVNGGSTTPNQPEQYATAPPPTTVPPPPPCVPTTTTETPTTTTTSTTTPRPPCIYTAPPTQPTLPTTLPPPPATYPTIPTNGYATSPTPSGYPTAPPPTQTTVIPGYPVPEWPTTAQPITTTTPQGGEVPPGPNGKCCYIDLRTIQAIVSCGAFGGSQKGCCSKSCSSSSQSNSQIQRQIQINFQLLSRYFGQIPTRISCTDAVRFGIVESREIDGVCPPQYSPFPTVELPTVRPDGEQPTTVTPPGQVVIPTNGPSDAYVKPPTSSVAAASLLTVVLATVLCL